MSAQAFSMSCGRFPVLDASAILEDLERKVRLYDSEMEEEGEGSLLLKIKVEIKEERGDAESYSTPPPFTEEGDSVRLKLEKQGSLLSGDRPDPLSIPHAVTSLSPLRIAAMSETELRAVLPELVATLQQGEVSRKPDWWPHSSIPWTPHCLNSAVKSADPGCLRGLVRQCYNYLTQQSVPLNPAQPRIPPQPRVLDWLNSQPPSHACVQPLKSRGLSAAKRKLKDGVPYLDIHLCYQCNQEFSARDTLHKHQCSGGSLVLSVPSTPPASDAPSPTPPTTASDNTSVSGATLSVSKPLLPSFSKFVDALDLVPVHRARKILQARRRNTECETIDLEEPRTPISPPTPRTPKLLISLLSRDGGTSSGSGGSGSHGASSRRRLSYLRHSMDRQEERGKEGEVKTDEESSDSGTDDTDEPKLHKKSLFSIDVTSGLGQRVLRHMTVEGHVPVVLDSEQFCRTPIKDKYQDRLRTRQLSYPVTWKCTGKRQRQQTHMHQYNFTRAQKFEFMEKMRTGLNWRCRKLLRCVRKSSVVVKRLSQKTLHWWKPSLNKLSVPLKRLTEREILFWTQPQLVRDHPSLSSQYLTVSAVRVDQALRLKHKDAGVSCCNPLCCDVVSSRIVVNGLSIPPKASTGQGIDQSCCDTSQQQGGVPLGKAVSSACVSSPGCFKSPCGGRERWNGAEVKSPLKIDIPSVSGRATVARAWNSPLDDSFSVMTVSSSDEDSTRTGVCCALCTMRNRSLTSPHRPPLAGRCCAHSPASISSGGNSVPPDGASRPVSSISSLPTVSPSCLSPPAASSSPPTCSSSSLSPTSHPALCCWRCSASGVKSGGCEPHTESSLCCLRPPGCVPAVSVCPHDCCPASPAGCAQTGLDSGRKDQTRWTQNGVVLRASEHLTKARIAVQRCKNRSSMRESKKLDLTVSSVSKPGCRSGSRERREMNSQQVTESAGTALCRQTVERDSTGNTVQLIGVGPCVQCKQQKRNQRDCSPSSEQIGGEQDMDARSDSGNTVHSSDTSQKSSHNTWHGTDGMDWLLCNGSDSHQVLSEGEQVATCLPKKRTLNGSVERISDIAHSSPDQKDADFLAQIERENGVDVECGRDVKQMTEVNGSSQDSAESARGSNPFLLSQAQSPLFSPPLLQQAQQHSNCPSDRSAPVTGYTPLGPGPAPSSVSPHRSDSSHKLSPLCSPAKTESSHPSPKDTPPARKLLSALQMLSVLESARSRTSPVKLRGSVESLGKRKKSKKRDNCGAMHSKAGYQTRSQESQCSVCPKKRAQLANRL